MPDTLTRLRRLEQLLDAVYPLVALLDDEGIVLEIGASGSRHTGLLPESLRGQPFADLPWWSDPETPSRLRRALRGVHGGATVRQVARLRGADGSDIPLVLSLSPLPGGGGVVVEGRHLRDAGVADPGSALDRLTASGVVGIVQGVEEYVVEGNAAFLALSGREPDGLHGGRLRWSDLVAGERAPIPLAGSTVEGTAASREIVLVRPDGTAVPVLVGAVRLDAAPQRWIAVVIDLTRQKAAQLEAERASRAKSEFLAVMSHELRTPLNAIRGYADILEFELHGTLTPEQQEDVHRIQRAERHLLELINTILSFARIEGGQIEYQIEPLATRRVLSEVHELVAPQMAAGQLFYTIGGTDTWVLADGGRLQQVLLNLLSNAIKFTEPGGRIHVDCSESNGRVLLAVADTGPGIPPEHQESIFDPFVQVGRTLRHPVDGTGLGLSISRQLVRGMGGELRLHSEVGRGSTFIVDLPAARPPHDGAPPSKGRESA